MWQNIQMPNARAIFAAAASAAATAVLIRSIANEYLPHEFRHYFSSKLRVIFASLSSEITVVIEEFDGLTRNELFYDVELYLGTKIAPLTHRFHAKMPAKGTKIMLSMDGNQEVIDVFNGAKFRWRKVSKQLEMSRMDPHDYQSPPKTKLQSLELSFHKKDKDMALNTYLTYILGVCSGLREETKILKLHTIEYLGHGVRRLGGNPWQAVNLDHPANFETLAMDNELKKSIMEDLERFVGRKEFYKRVGKAWKRGYLLFGPPGTGKSSLIAAMANYLNFDVYDLLLTDISSDAEMRRLLLTTANRSILVVEDIDCSFDLQNRAREQRATQQPWYPNQRNEVSLSGFLNFTDGLWSSCGDGRIIVFTTNHKDRLDPALLRPGRMDVHIHMSYCSPCGFKLLASNYLGITHHSLFSEVEKLMQTAKVTPAEVAEQLMRSEEPDATLRGLIEFLEANTAKNQEKTAAEGVIILADSDETIA
ncbi:hypothetical protein Nepgr_020015 [Nepenthes gracilis]|uniref:AAA+ ATPase domain-containing protein n=1 Tax=Nepenthes gracilis TaxID=150966 RepID=A0AAD3SW82_NEPGR|nr:hypothetical protein Nepgr_020015 [Nepenthes gracilis]